MLIRTYGKVSAGRAMRPSCLLPWFGFLSKGCIAAQPNRSAEIMRPCSRPCLSQRTPTKCPAGWYEALQVPPVAILRFDSKTPSLRQRPVLNNHRVHFLPHCGITACDRSHSLHSLAKRSWGIGWRAFLYPKCQAKEEVCETRLLCRSI